MNLYAKVFFFFCSQRWRSSIQTAKTRLGTDCGSDPELLIAKFRLKLKKVGKTTRPFRYDLNQIPYDYTVEVRNRFKGLDLIDRVPEELWTEVRDIVQETGIKTIPMEKKCKKAKWLFGEALQIGAKRREAKSKGEKERYKHPEKPRGSPVIARCSPVPLQRLRRSPTLGIGVRNGTCHP